VSPRYDLTGLLLNVVCRSREWFCPHCQQSNLGCLPNPPAPDLYASTNVPGRENEHSEIPPTSADAVMPVVDVTSSPGPSTPRFDISSQQETSDGGLASHTINSLTSSQSPSRPGTSFLTPAGSVAEQATTETARVGPSQGSGFSRSTAPGLTSRPLILRTLDTAIYVLLAVAVAVACRRVT
jgi:ubiquitin-conjugating enzyme E2 J1